MWNNIAKMVKTLQLERYLMFAGIVGLLTTQVWSASNRWPPEGCIRQSDILTCTGTIPPHVPQGIKEVTMELSDIQIRKITTEHLFCRISWSAIERLWISDAQTRPFIYNMYDHMFKCLANLITLTLMLPNIEDLPEHTFAGLDKVTTLDMSNCVHLTPTGLFKGLKDTKNLPNLSNLVLHKMNTNNDRTAIFTKQMFQTLSRGRNITQLDMSNMRLSSDSEEYVTKGLCQTVQVLNVSGVRFINVANPNDNSGNGSPCYSLETLDISGRIIVSHVPLATDVSIVNENIEITYDTYPDTLFFKNITTFYSSNINPIVYGKYAYIYDSMLNFSILNNLKHIYLSNNKLKYMDCVVVSECIRLETLDLSENDMEYLTPRIFQHRMITSLRKLDISQNMLWRMESNQTELETMFTNLIHLEILHLSDNNLSKIPKGMFEQNRNLHHLDISSNKLTQVTFGMEHLIHLRYFDISGNRFVHVDSTTIRVFNNIFAIQTNMGSDHLNVNLHNNPLQCYTCSNLAFAEWISTSPIIDNNHERYMCESETRAKKPFDREIVSEIQHICDRAMILRRTVLLATLIPAAAITLLVITIRYAAKLIIKKRDDAHVEKIRRQIENNQYKFKYPIFLSYSSLDDDIVLNHLYEDIQHHLRVFCRTDRELVCIGDRHFRAGQWISDEVSRCLEMSALLVVVMSKNYCRSDWCIAEVQQAYQQHKQMLLIFIEDVDEKDMHPILRDHFRKRVRVKLYNTDNGDYEIQPEWDTVCSSIIGIRQ